jgi:ubiquinone/menaquinone biosynthesis C-methylase UbiE
MAKDSFKFSGEAAMNYDRYLGPIMFEPAAIELVSKIETSNITSVLELACGTGRVTRHLRQLFAPQVQLMATDFNADMLGVALEKLDGEEIEFRVEDAQELSFADNSFDLIVFQFGLMFLKDKHKGLHEALRVLKPGGKFIFSTWDKLDNLPLIKLIIQDIVIAYYKDEDLTRFKVPFSLHDPSMLEAWMKEANFVNINADHVTFSGHSPSLMEIVNGYFVKHSLGAEVFDKDSVAFDKMTIEIEQIVAKQFGEKDIDFPLTAFFVSGEKKK